ncbi:MAG: Slp family lipoprotein [Rhodanobacteraceae bacterium]
MTLKAHISRILVSVGLLVLAGCAADPVYPPTWATSMAEPRQVATAPETAADARVIWGGEIISVENKADHTEVQVLGFPLDKNQIPRADDTGDGRFIAVLPGFVEPLDYPVGGWVTMQGHIQGVRNDRVGQAPYVFPLLKVHAAHVWSQQDMQQRSNVHFNLGVGIRIR